MKKLDEKYRPFLKLGLLLCTYAVVLYLALSRFSLVVASLDWIAAIFSPFLIGISLAFLLNLLLRLLEEKIFCRLKGRRIWEKLKRPLCLGITYLLSLALLTSLFAVLVPEIGNSLAMLTSNFSGYLSSARELVARFSQYLQGEGVFWADITAYVNSLLNSLGNAVQNILPHLLDYTKTLTSNVFNTIMGIIISIYILADKENLLRRAKRITVAFLSGENQEKVFEVAALTNKAFSGFIAGKLVDSVIIGILSFLGMSLFRMPYALLISVIIGITNIIPVFGPFVGAIPGAFIILIAEPGKALWFILFVVFLQQLDGNIIGPMIVGDSIGLPGIWVIFAILLGGGLMGIAGMIVGIPIFAVFYALFRTAINQRIAKISQDPQEAARLEKLDL